MEPNLKEKLDAIIAALQTKHHIPGVSIAVVKNGEVVLTSGYGHTELQQDSETRGASLSGKRVDEHTKFNIASITKGFTAVSLANILQYRKE